MKTPVALIIFNRPESTEQVFSEIAKARPSKLLVIADGPRANHPEDTEKCSDTRAIIERVDWDCEVLTNYSPENLGCKVRPVSGLDWVFENVSEAIVLEDDCLAHPSFFRFCEELLERYRDDERIMTISGNNFQFNRHVNDYSYHFSRYPNTWGWATWRRAWQFRDLEMKMLPLLENSSWLLDVLGGHEEAASYWQKIFAEAAAMKSVWDFQWMFACWTQNALSISPNLNLVSNIGFGKGSTHTGEDVSAVGNLPTTEMPFPLRHPPYVLRDRAADEFLFRIYAAQGGLQNNGMYRRLRLGLSSKTPAAVRTLINQIGARLGSPRK